MKMKNTLALLALLFAGCSGAVIEGSQEPNAQEHEEDHAHEEGDKHATAPQSGIALPASVRENLGITFARVEARAIDRTRRLPGEFELLPTARQEYRAVLAGRISLRVQQFERVEAGQLLYTVDSPRWREMQHEAVEAEGDITMAQAALEVARAQRQEAVASLAKQEERLQSLAKLQVRKAELESEASVLRNSIPRLDAEIRAQEAALREAHEHYGSRLNALSSVTGVPVEDLRREENGVAAWHGITLLEVRARQAGVVEDMAANEGAWLEDGVLAISIVDPAKVRFHAEAPQAELVAFQDGQAATLLGPEGEASITGILTLGLTAHADDRTISLYITPETVPAWVRAGVGGYVEIALDETAKKQLAIPLAAVVQDGLEHVFYRRSPKDPDRVLRVPADMGANDGRWVAIRSGVKEGDEVVLEGAYALKLSSGGQQAPPGYHYHADGQLHKNH